MKIAIKQYLVTHTKSDETKTFDTDKEAYEYISSKEIGEEYFILDKYKVVEENDLTYRLTICMPVYQKPARTRRMIDCLMDQTENGWEAYIWGDACPHFQQLIDTGYFDALQRKAIENGNFLHIRNNSHNKGGYGAAIRNEVTQLARGKRILWIDNDDMIDSRHIRKYLQGIEGTNFDFVAYESWIHSISYQRETDIVEGKIGFSELIVNTEFLRRMPPIVPAYSHDYHLVMAMVGSGASYTIVRGAPYTYKVMSLPNKPEVGID